MIKNGVYEFYFASCMNIIFNELRHIVISQTVPLNDISCLCWYKSMLYCCTETKINIIGGVLHKPLVSTYRNPRERQTTVAAASVNPSSHTVPQMFL